MKLITVTNLYPGADRPRHGVFVRERLEHIVATGRATARVVALRPGIGGGRSREAAAGLPQDSAGIEVRYQSVPTLPLLSNWVDPLTWSVAAERAVRDALGAERRDAVIDAHFLYPDGIAATILGRRLDLPVVLSARGSDVNVKCRNPVMRRWVRWAADRADAVITVSRALAGALTAFDIHPRRLEVIPNGVDHDKFRPLEREACRARFGVNGRVVASVGHLTPAKGHDLAIMALQGLPDHSLLIVGEGSERGPLERLAQRIGVADRTVFAGLVAHSDMAAVYSAADVLVLPSLREGMPNVVLESLASGTPVIATDVGGIREVITDSVAGELLAERSAGALRAALERRAGQKPDPEAVREFSRRFDWTPLVERQLDLYASVVRNRAVAEARSAGV